jgi:hypothetical protein
LSALAPLPLPLPAPEAIDQATIDSIVCSAIADTARAPRSIGHLERPSP